jgi:hypothetical protein
MILFISGCEPSPRDRLQGKWVGEEVQEIHPSQQGRAAGWARGTRLEFAGNKVTVAVPAESPRTGTFKVAKVDKQGLEVVFRRPEGGEDRSHFAFSDDGRLLWTLGGGVQLVMRKE